MMKFFCSAWFLMNFSIVMDAVGLLVQEKHGSFDKVIQASTGSSRRGMRASEYTFAVNFRTNIKTILICSRPAAWLENKSVSCHKKRHLQQPALL